MRSRFIRTASKRVNGTSASKRHQQTTIMDDISIELSDIVEQPSDLMDILANDSHDIDHAQVIEEFNSFASSHPEIDSFTSEQLQHGLGDSSTLLSLLSSFLVCACDKLYYTKAFKGYCTLRRIDLYASCVS